MWNILILLVLVMIQLLLGVGMNRGYGVWRLLRRLLQLVVLEGLCPVH